MPTTAIFYIGKGKDAELLGGFLSDGFPFYEDAHGQGVPRSIVAARSAAAFKKAVQEYARHLDITTLWDFDNQQSWNASKKFDYVYSFFDGRVWISQRGGGWHNRIAGIARPLTAPPGPLIRKGKVAYSGFVSITCGDCHYNLMITLDALRRKYGIDARLQDAKRYFRSKGFELTGGFGWQCPRCLKKKRK